MRGWTIGHGLPRSGKGIAASPPMPQRPRTIAAPAWALISTPPPRWTSPALRTDLKAVLLGACKLWEGLRGRAAVEQANAYELAINRKTVRILGIELPRSLLLRATRVID